MSEPVPISAEMQPYWERLNVGFPDVRAVFELNARETHNHYEMIESEYARVMTMVHESDMDTYVRE